MKDPWVEQAIQAIGRKATANIATNESAKLTRIAGRFTGEGLAQADMDTQGNAMDRINIKMAAGRGLLGSTF